MELTWYQKLRQAGGALYEAELAYRKECSELRRQRLGVGLHSPLWDKITAKLKIITDNHRELKYKLRGWSERSRLPNELKFKRTMLNRARNRANAMGIVFSLELEDVTWPIYCPVFGTLLAYGGGKHTSGKLISDDAASLDRWINTEGYVPGNVYVISFRANRLKADATADELEAVAAYARDGPEDTIPNFLEM